MLQAELRVLTGKHAGSVIPLPAGKFLIGREHDCHLRPNSDLVSRHHCVFTVDEFTARLRDLGSTNGTLLNGERLRGTAVLKPGDEVTVGNLTFTVVIDGEPPVEEPVAEEPVAPPEEADVVTPESTETLNLDGDTAYNQMLAPPPATEPVEAQGFMLNPDPQPMYGTPPQYPPAPPPGYPQYPPPGYPPPPYGYGYPYPPMPPGYPPPPGYGQPMPPQAAPPQNVEVPRHQVEGEIEDETGARLKLPDPSETGAKDPEPVKQEASKSADAHIPTAAQAIIDKFRNRRPPEPKK